MEDRIVPLNVQADDLCGICFCTELNTEPCVRLACGHVFHANCMLQLLDHRYTTLRITFGYLDCPSCKQEIALDYKVPILTEQLLKHLELKYSIMRQSIKQAKKDGHHLVGRVVTPGDHYYGKLADFALH